MKHCLFGVVIVCLGMLTTACTSIHVLGTPNSNTRIYEDQTHLLVFDAPKLQQPETKSPESALAANLAVPLAAEAVKALVKAEADSFSEAYGANTEIELAADSPGKIFVLYRSFDRGKHAEWYDYLARAYPDPFVEKLDYRTIEDIGALVGERLRHNINRPFDAKADMLLEDIKGIDKGLETGKNTTVAVTTLTENLGAVREVQRAMVKANEDAIEQTAKHLVDAVAGQLNEDAATSFGVVIVGMLIPQQGATDRYRVEILDYHYPYMKAKDLVTYLPLTTLDEATNSCTITFRGPMGDPGYANDQYSVSLKGIELKRDKYGLPVWLHGYKPTTGKVVDPYYTSDVFIVPKDKPLRLSVSVEESSTKLKATIESASDRINKKLKAGLADK